MFTNVNLLTSIKKVLANLLSCIVLISFTTASFASPSDASPSHSSLSHASPSQRASDCSSHCNNNPCYTYSTPCYPLYQHRCHRNINDAPCSSFDQWTRAAWCDIQRDYSIFYSPDYLILGLGNFLIGAGTLANTDLDRRIRNHWQSHIRNARVNAFLEPFNTLGSFSFQQFSVYLLGIGLGCWRPQSEAAQIVYTWSYRSVRSFLLGTIPQVVLAKGLGAGRPIRGNPSYWTPFKHRMSVSGHTYWAATPFLTAAFMTENPVLKAALFGISTLPGFARINKDAHYTSQTVLGWGIAFLSVKAVYDSDNERDSNWCCSMAPTSDGFMFRSQCRF